MEESANDMPVVAEKTFPDVFFAAMVWCGRDVAG
jgi:hypothetical protein